MANRNFNKSHAIPQIEANGSDANQIITHGLTLNTIMRVHQIEVTRDSHHGPNESSVHTPEDARTFREAIEKAWPGGRITWAFSWRALHDEREQYQELRDLIVNYHRNNDALDYQFVHRGSGIRASESDKEIRWFMNRDFRLALLRNWKEDGREKVIDFTRYDLPAREPASSDSGKPAWPIRFSGNPPPGANVTCGFTTATTH